MKTKLLIMFAAGCLSLSAGAQTVVLPPTGIDYGGIERKLAESVSACGSVGEMALACQKLPAPSDAAELALRWEVFSRAGFEVELEKLAPLLGKESALGDWYYGRLAEGAAARERWRLLRMLLELRPQVSAGAKELHEHWAESGAAVDEETWLRQRLALTVELVYDTGESHSRNVWVRELFDGQRRDALVAEWRERARQGDFIAVRDLICAGQFTAEMAAEFEPQCAAQALTMGVALRSKEFAGQALALLDKALTMPFGAEERKYIQEAYQPQQPPMDYGQESNFRRLVLYAKQSVYISQHNEAGRSEIDRLIKESEPQRIRYQIVKSGTVTTVTAVPEDPQTVEIRRLCDLAREHRRKEQWREAFAAYERALTLMPGKDWRRGKKDETQDRDMAVVRAADCLQSAGDTAGAVKFLREQLAAMPPWGGEWTAGKLCDLMKDKITPEDEALLWHWLAGAGDWYRAPEVLQALTAGHTAEEQDAVWRRVRELAENGDLDKQFVCARQRKDTAWLERLARADWSQSAQPWHKGDAMRELYDLYCEQGKWREAGEWLPSVHPPLLSGGLFAWAKLAALMANDGDEAGALALWRKLLAYDLCAAPFVPLPEKADARRALLALHEELAARYPDSAGLAKSIEFLRKQL